MNDAPQFVRFTPNGRVHVMKGYRKLDLLVGESFGDRLAEAVMARQRAYCGKEGKPGLQYGLGTFDDVDLCQRCVKAWPHDSELLFEHPIPPVPGPIVKRTPRYGWKGD